MRSNHLAVVVLHRHPGPEVGAPGGVGARLDDRERIHALGELAQAAVQLAQLLLAVEVLGVLAPVAQRGGRLDLGDDARPLTAPDALVLLGDAPEALGGDVARQLAHGGSGRGDDTVAWP